MLVLLVSLPSLASVCFSFISIHCFHVHIYIYPFNTISGSWNLEKEFEWKNLMKGKETVINTSCFQFSAFLLSLYVVFHLLYCIHVFQCFNELTSVLTMRIFFPFFWIDETWRTSASYIIMFMQWFLSLLSLFMFNLLIPFITEFMFNDIIHFLFMFIIRLAMFMFHELHFSKILVYKWFQ